VRLVDAFRLPEPATSTPTLFSPSYSQLLRTTLVPSFRKDHERRFTLPLADIAAINPNTRTAPIFRSKADAELTLQIYARMPALVDEAKGEAGILCPTPESGIERYFLLAMSGDLHSCWQLGPVSSSTTVRDRKSLVIRSPIST
jgi:hypothetical protein